MRLGNGLKRQPRTTNRIVTSSGAGTADRFEPDAAGSRNLRREDLRGRDAAKTVRYRTVT